MQTGVVLERPVNPPPRGANVPTPVHDLNVPYEATKEYETPTTKMLFPPVWSHSIVKFTMFISLADFLLCIL